MGSLYWVGKWTQVPISNKKSYTTHNYWQKKDNLANRIWVYKPHLSAGLTLHDRWPTTKKMNSMALLVDFLSWCFVRVVFCFMFCCSVFFIFAFLACRLVVHIMWFLVLYFLWDSWVCKRLCLWLHMVMCFFDSFASVCFSFSCLFFLFFFC